MSVVTGFIVTPVVDAVRALLSVILHPGDSVRSIVMLPGSCRDAVALIDEMYGGGAVIATPPDAPLLRTVLSGLGNVATTLDPRGVTENIVAQHLERIRARLQPLADLSVALTKLHATLGIVVAVVVGWVSAKNISSVREA